MSGETEQVADVDLTSTLDMHVDQGIWKRAIGTSPEHDTGTPLKHLAKHATQLIKERIPFGALQPCRKYGTLKITDNRSNPQTRVILHKSSFLPTLQAKKVDTGMSNDYAEKAASNDTGPIPVIKKHYDWRDQWFDKPRYQEGQNDMENITKTPRQFGSKRLFKELCVIGIGAYRTV